KPAHRPQDAGAPDWGAPELGAPHSHSWTLPNSLVLTRRSGSRMKSIVSLPHMHVGDVGVNLRRRNVAVPEQGLHGTRVGAVLQQVRRKAVPQRVRRDVGHARFLCVLLNDSPGVLSR